MRQRDAGRMVLVSSSKGEKWHTKKKGSRSGFVTKQRDVTFRHPQPATNVPMNCSLASNVVSS